MNGQRCDKDSATGDPVFRPKFWKTRDGTVIPIASMSNGHLRNSIRMMRENGFIEWSTVKFYLTCAEPNGDMAQLAFEREQMAIFNKRTSLVLDDLVEELERRGLEELPQRCPDD